MCSPDTRQTSPRHLLETLKTLFRQPTDTLQMPTRQSPKFSLVGSFLLLEARCGLFLGKETKTLAVVNEHL